jgi:hypothetical protein
MKYPFTIQQVRDWAATKPPTEHYDYYDNSACALAQFLKETARSADPFVLGTTWVSSEGNSIPIQRALRVPLQAETFGDLVAQLSNV